MIIEIDSTKYEIEFRYETDSKNRRVTYCTLSVIVENPDGSINIPVTIEGRAICAAGDSFKKETGRKLALARAIEDFEKEWRKKLWNAFHSVRGKENYIVHAGRG